ncbi:MAG: thiamine diphosphokinase [Firmicutes bacterium]|nr:thiamine diphosphokinase [Bacillota bacterium]
MEKFCILVCGGKRDLTAFERGAGDFLIAVDKGADYLCDFGLVPDLVIGDFDSISQEPSGKEVIRLNREKDETDTLSAVKLGLKRGYKNFKLFCALGGRLSHTVANIQTLKYLAENGYHGEIISKDTSLTAVCGKALTVKNDNFTFVSVFSLSESATVTLTGFKYPLDNFLLSSSNPVGVSNEFLNKTAVVEVKSGCVLVVLEKKAD